MSQFNIYSNKDYDYLYSCFMNLKYNQLVQLLSQIALKANAY